ncbi:MAG: acyl-CoA dehydrogenase C-terminal domain-containing protein [Gemmatimonadaceae bacterium]|jgi:alkylation response protein AidB-like acyl-CoA dehydrogenase|nr:acyl-CoA dehydrogenase C-terminal domain-containing protein [Gemmatimonadaceae bacterium]
MPAFKAPLDDIRFVLDEIAGLAAVSALPGFEEATPDLLHTVVAEGAKFCETVLFPINQSGDIEGVRLEDGEVKTPAGFKDAYTQYREGGWTGLTADPAYGGQGLPYIISTVMEELLCASNLSFSMYPGLSHGAYQAMSQYGSDEIKERFMAKLVDGTWSGTMCLTEAHAGTDLGILTTRAVPAGDGAYHITGTKIFISAGEHDLTENILHLVLAKLPDAPAGTKGISMFIVPKYLPTDEGRPGTKNGVTCGSIEHKMGIKASATCVLNFDNAKGWMVGEAHKGMRAMFVMMNGARLAVGMQGLGLAEVAYQNALAYAKDRVQGRALTGPKNPTGVADLIVVHPDVRRGLLRQKAFIEGARALAYTVGAQIDIEHRATDPAVREAAADFVALMTPVVKAFLTDQAFDCTNIALQTLGGHGYIREFGMEQYVRDARIAQIYEGTNGVQALDLVGRKLPMEGGRLVRRWFELVGADLEAASADDANTEFVQPVRKALLELQKATMLLAERGFANPDEAGAAASDYLAMMGYTALGHMWVKQVVAARRHLADGSTNGDRRFYEAKLKTARFYVQKMLPESSARWAALQAGAGSVMAVAVEEF